MPLVWYPSQRHVQPYERPCRVTAPDAAGQAAGSAAPVRGVLLPALTVAPRALARHRLQLGRHTALSALLAARRVAPPGFVPYLLYRWQTPISLAHSFLGILGT